MQRPPLSAMAKWKMGFKPEVWIAQAWGEAEGEADQPDYNIYNPNLSFTSSVWQQKIMFPWLLIDWQY